MTHADFENLLDRRLGLIRSVLSSKAKEYAADTDRLYNFKKAAALTGNSPAVTLEGMLVKHWICVQDLAAKSWMGPVPRAITDEKIGDAINYLILLEALLTEERP